MTRINSRAKGANAELEVAKILQTVVNRVAIHCGFTAPKIRRNVEQCQVGGEDLIGLPWYSIEIKRVEVVNIDKWWEQTLTQARRKAPGATSWDALAKHGWKRIAASEAAAVGSAGLGQVEAARGASDALGAGEAARLASGDVGSVPLAGGGSMSAREVLREELAEAARTNLGLYLSAQAGNEGRPLPSWSLGGGLGRDRSQGGPVVGPALVGEPSDSLGLSLGLLRCVASEGKPVSSPVTARSVSSPCESPSKDSNAEKQVPMAREPVLIWRTNNKPWMCRFLGTLVTHNGFRLASVVDASLETWLEVLREDLGFRLRG